jgi:serine protease Do
MYGSAESRRRRAAKIAGTVALVLAVAVGVGALSWLIRPTEGTAGQIAPPDLATLESVERGFTWIADQVKPAVVFVEVERKVRGQELEGEGPDVEAIPEPFRRFFGPDSPFEGPPRTPPRIPIGQGSGVVIDPGGYILTNNHVVGDAAEVTVHMADGASYVAEVAGTDRISDLAVIKIEPDEALPAARLGDASAARVGSWAMAIGFPFGGSRSAGRFDEALRYEPTVTVGVVSAVERQIQSDIPGRPFRNLIQTDAPINPGSSGGPLVNIRGEVIGINQAIFTNAPWGGNIGVGFAIAIDESTKRIIEDLKRGDEVVRGQLGVLIEPLTEPLKADYGADYGVFVTEVQEDSAAERGGLRSEDVVVAYDGRRIDSVDQFVSSVQNTRPGTTVEIEVIRAGERKTLKVTVEELTLAARERQPRRVEQDRLGLAVQPVSPEDAAEMGVPGGVRVLEVHPMGDGARAGVRPGDVIVKIKAQPVNDMSDYREAVRELKPGESLTMRVWREGHMITLQLARLSG